MSKALTLFEMIQQAEEAMRHNNYAALTEIAAAKMANGVEERHLSCPLVFDCTSPVRFTRASTGIY
jgi:hypothetical protein